MTKTIGSKETAAALFKAMGGSSYKRDGDYKRSPKGFKRIGSGCYRVAYLHKDTGVVYKMGSHHSNESEAMNANRLLNRALADLPGITVKIPLTEIAELGSQKMGNYTASETSVIIQEFAEGAKPTYCDTLYNYSGKPERHLYKCTCKREQCYGDVLKAVKAWSGISDMHGGNLLHNPKTDVYWLVDMGM